MRALFMIVDIERESSPSFPPFLYLSLVMYPPCPPFIPPVQHQMLGLLDRTIKIVVMYANLARKDKR